MNKSLTKTLARLATGAAVPMLNAGATMAHESVENEDVERGEIFACMGEF